MAGTLIDPGAFTARLVLERPERTADGQGGAVRDFTAAASLWARIEPVSAARAERAGGEAMTVTHRIWLRHRADVESGMRLRKGARLFSIRGFRDPDETRRYLVCDCEEEER
ncbi:MAG: phage head closure protein [Shinella sp.]|nr:phage head closure protein [Shinella sp.]